MGSNEERVKERLRELSDLRKNIRKAEKEDAHHIADEFKNIRRKKIEEIRRLITNK